MILTALMELRKRLESRGLTQKIGFERKSIRFSIIIDRNGFFQRFGILSSGLDSKSDRGAELEIPASVVKGTSTKVNPLCDDLSWILGIQKEDVETNQKDVVILGQEKLSKRMQAFRENAHEILDGCSHPSAKAVLKFLDSPEEIEKVSSHVFLKEVVSYGAAKEIDGKKKYPCIYPRVAFEILSSDGTSEYLTDVNEVKDAYSAWNEQNCTEMRHGYCAVTGEYGPLPDTHGRIKGLGGVNGLAFLSFNAPAFSYDGLEQGSNFPVSNAVAVGYVEALNWLVRFGSKNMVRAGATTYVMFGDSKTSKVLLDYGQEGLDWLSPEPDEARAASMVATINSPNIGELPPDDGMESFYVFGLTSGSGRLYPVMQKVCSVNEMKASYCQYFEDLRIDGIGQPDRITIKGLIRASSGGKDTLPESIGREVMDGLIYGSGFPTLLITSAFHQAEKHMMKTGKKEVVGKDVAMCLGVLKAEYNRKARKMGRQEMKSSNVKSDSVAYHMGRYLSWCDRIQRMANKNVSSSISGQLVGGMMSAPIVTLGRAAERMTRIVNGMDVGGRVWSQKRFGEVCEDIQRCGPVPKTFSAQDKVEFFMGFYTGPLREVEEKSSPSNDDGKFPSSDEVECAGTMEE